MNATPLPLGRLLQRSFVACSLPPRFARLSLRGSSLKPRYLASSFHLHRLGLTLWLSPARCPCAAFLRHDAMPRVLPALTSLYPRPLLFSFRTSSLSSASSRCCPFGSPSRASASPSSQASSGTSWAAPAPRRSQGASTTRFLLRVWRLRRHSPLMQRLSAAGVCRGAGNTSLSFR
jgi:hypothetical protein